ncbi:sugar transferase [Neolewinella antarctica]|uniref:Lipopolysaccharide/colanic/teichoic acid biosynthesis glycosyltransferase n=1 Tax=Neolewinella antarctica TaxID=442734 RepID=A0ABX0XB02_9BACT|nr:sugar transferase [Neolewinella antarctica]NJC26134.1 lipopolysaccharide/colanic/teichoic acid biosynthesis glycosyltransferase [Neolewinella antarctica]
MYLVVKRFFDIVASLVALVILSPLLIPIVIGLKLTGEGHVFYFQERLGLRNEPFSIYKFATMLKDSPNMKGGLITTKKDPRLTPMGDFLRKSKINELPQLLNILFGDMSFVGPRPVMRKSFEQYPADVQKVIYNVKPGLTGVGSIVFRDEEELITRERDAGRDTWVYYREVIYPHKGKIEQWYQANQSFWVDLQVLLLTAWVILFPESDAVYQAFPEIPRFEG